jgi:hypothetical protein
MPAPFPEGPLREAVRHLFNADLAASQSVLSAYLRHAPHDPLAHALKAAVPFYHFVSMRIPERETRSIVGVLLGPGIAMPPALQKEIGSTLRCAKTLATQLDDPSTLLALCIVEGVNRDGLALVSKHWSASLAHAERAHILARRLLEHEAAAHDAYFVFGSTEYFISRIPDSLRSFAHIPGVAGDPKKALKFCEIAAASGWYFQEFARRTLVNLYVDEGRFADAVQLMGELVAEFPGNAMLRSDHARLEARLCQMTPASVTGKDAESTPTKSRK